MRHSVGPHRLTEIRLDRTGTKREMVFQRASDPPGLPSNMLVIDAGDKALDGIRVGDYCLLEWTAQGLAIHETSR